MKIKIPRQIFTGLVVMAALTVACACPFTPSISDLLGGDEAVEGLQQTAMVMLTEVPIDGLQETAIAAMTEIPAEDLMKTAESFATVLPGGEGMMETAAAEFGVLPGFGNGDTPPGDMMGEPPPDIPVLDGAENLLANPKLVTYTSQKPQSEAVEFYKTQMPANGWEYLEEHTNETDSSAILTYKKPNRTALVGVTHLNGVTTITVSIQTN